MQHPASFCQISQGWSALPLPPLLLLLLLLLREYGLFQRRGAAQASCLRGAGGLLCETVRGRIAFFRRSLPVCAELAVVVVV